MSKTPEEMAGKHFTIQDIRIWNPCYDPERHLPENWSGTVANILRHETIPADDKLWVVCREGLIDAKTLRLFAVWCARSVEHLLTDERSRKAIDVAELCALGQATHEELAIAWAAARDARAAGDAARDAAGAAWAARDAGDAARAAARDAAWAAWAAGAAGAAAWDAARAANDAQVKQLLKMVEDK